MGNQDLFECVEDIAPLECKTTLLAKPDSCEDLRFFVHCHKSCTKCTKPWHEEFLKTWDNYEATHGRNPYSKHHSPRPMITLDLGTLCRQLISMNENKEQ